MNPEILENLGLSKNESKVYLSLIKLGSASVSQIAKISNAHRVNIYDALERLQEKGFVASTIKSNKKYFRAASPEIIKDLIKQKEEQIKQSKQALPTLIYSYKNSMKKQELSSFKGVLGVKTVLNEILNSKPKEILNFGSTKSVETFSKLHVDIWESQRIKLKIPMKIITSKKIKNIVKERKLQKIKFIEKPFDTFTSTVIWNNHVAIFLWLEEPLATLIESKELADSYKNYFYSLWESK